jgi:hypothetical protein
MLSAAVLVVMNIMLLSGVQQFIPTPATSLVLLLLLALGTFLAGLNLSLLPICFLGAALAFAVPIISWLKLSVLFFGATDRAIRMMRYDTSINASNLAS